MCWLGAQAPAAAVASSVVAAGLQLDVCAALRVWTTLRAGLLAACVDAWSVYVS